MVANSNASRKQVLVTGAAGFIGFHFCKKLLAEGYSIVGVDNCNAYYSVELKNKRLNELKHPQFEFHKIAIETREFEELVSQLKIPNVVHLAAQAGVRYSLINPWAYIDSNIVGFQRLLEGLRTYQPQHVIFASSSSVYGKNEKVPYSTDDRTDDMVSLYAATKKSNELVASTYAHLFQMPLTALRFFTVYGSWGRPDMAYYSFTNKIMRQEPIELFNNGHLRRDFTHVSDIVESMFRLIHLPPSGFRVLNIGASQPVELMDFVKTLEDVLGQKAKIKLSAMQPGDVLQTYADVSLLEKLTGYKPKVSLKEGLHEFATWYKNDNGGMYK